MKIRTFWTIFVCVRVCIYRKREREREMELKSLRDGSQRESHNANLTTDRRNEIQCDELLLFLKCITTLKLPWF